MLEEPPERRNLSDKAIAELTSAWQEFDEASAEAQALLLGNAIMQTPSPLQNRLQKEFGREFGHSRSDLIAIGGQFLDFAFSDVDETFAQVKSIVEGMQSEADHIENSDREHLQRGSNWKQPGLSPEIMELNLVPPEAWHAFFMTMMRSQPSGGWFWRSILHDSFDLLSAGDEPELFRRRTIYRHGRPIDFEYCKRLSVLKVYFRAGTGAGVDASRREVASSLGVSFDTLKTWSDALRKSAKGKNEMECAKLAARFGEEFKNRAADQFENIDQFGSYEGIFNLKRAESLYWQLSDISLETLKGWLLRSRSKTKPSGKR
ncbi:hypothetical protein [Hoeflea sp. TYP-13]|uniref:hypothetical protein n=1 Tax=Hoeflea sp. TYP-13 TaxID=3230023 RepID=UPI0034C62CD3